MDGSVMDRLDVCVIGAGPAGLMAAIHAAVAGTRATVLEANPVAGRKLLLTGGGRCNLTHACQPQEMLAVFRPRDRFLRHALYELSPSQVIEFFQQRRLGTRVESDGGVFPVTDRAEDVRVVLLEEARRHGVTILYGRKVGSISREGIGLAVRAGKEAFSAGKVILATGGLSYPQTGSTGDGLRMADALGHKIVTPRPALAPLVTQEKWPGSLAGVSVDRVTMWTRPEGRKITESGALLFTQDGIGGPAVMNLSRFLTDLLPNRQNPIVVGVDLLSSLREGDLEMEILQRAQVGPKKTIAHLLAGLVPRRLAAALVGQAGCPEDLQASQLSKENRRRLVKVLKALELHIVSTRPMAEATITRGGILTSEIDPKSMESKVCPGLFFAGEVIDVDGPCGGYNLQMCWSTGALAGRSASQSLARADEPNA